MRKNREALHLASPTLKVRPLVSRTILCALVLGSVAATQHLSAQGIERESLAGETAAAASHGSDTNQPYNLRVGPVTVRAEAGLSTAYNDNINVAYTGRQHDFIVTPTVDFNGLWQATDLNALSFDIGIGYQWYTIHSSNSNLIITPSSQTQFNIYTGDFKINLHDRFSFSSNPLQVAQLSNVNQFPVFNNTVGFQVDWDLSDLIPSIAYDHNNQWVYSSSYNYLTSQSDTITPKLTFKVSDKIETGVSAAFTSMRYNEDVQNNSLGVVATPFVTAQLNENISVSAQAGVDITDYQTGGTNGDSSNLVGFTGSLGLNHRINDVLTESLTGGQEYIPGVTSNYTQRDYINYLLGWQATDFLHLGYNLWFEHLDDSQAVSRQTANRVGTGLSLGYKLTDQANLTLSYQYVLKDADPSNLGYTQDLVTLQFGYQF